MGEQTLYDLKELLTLFADKYSKLIDVNEAHKEQISTMTSLMWPLVDCGRHKSEGNNTFIFVDNVHIAKMRDILKTSTTLNNEIKQNE